MNNFYAHFMGETGPTRLHEMEKKRLTLLLEYYNQKYNRTKYVQCNIMYSMRFSPYLHCKSLSLFQAASRPRARRIGGPGQIRRRRASNEVKTEYLSSSLHRQEKCLNFSGCKFYTSSSTPFPATRRITRRICKITTPLTSSGRAWVQVK